MPGSGEWLLTDPLLTDWKNKSSSSIIWLRGIPGSGKSKLVSILIDEMHHSAEKHLSPPPVYFYCSRNPAEPGSSQAKEVAASIARQLSYVDEKSLLEPAIQKYKERQRTGFSKGPLDLDETRALIIELLAYYPVATIILDALDECTLESREELLDTIDYIVQESPTLVKIFVSSRDDQDIASQLQGYPKVELSSSKNSKDITAFVHQEVQVLKCKRPLRGVPNVEEVAQSIISKITTEANGMFLWASLQLQILRELKTLAAIEERVGRLPQRLSDIYDELLQQIEAYPSEADRTYARNALCLLLCAICPLDVTQFLGLISVLCHHQVSQDQILDLCRNLIVLDTTSSTFQFAHLSVREFLEGHPIYELEKSHRVAATLCLVTLIRSCENPFAIKALANVNLPVSGEPPCRETIMYAAMFWCEHCRLADAEPHQSELGDLLWEFLSGENDKLSPLYGWWNQIDSIFLAEPYQYGSRFYSIERQFRTSAGHSGGPSAALLACCFDLHKFVAEFKVQGRVHLDTRNLYGNDCAALAALYKSTATLQILLGDEIHHYDKMSPAVDERNDLAAFVEILLDPHRRNSPETVVNSGVLDTVVSSPVDGHKLLQFILRKLGDGINVTYGLVSRAVAFGSCETVRLLLENARPSIPIDSALVGLAAANPRHALEIVSFLCAEPHDSIQITREMIVAAARNYDHGKEIVDVILLTGESSGNHSVTSQMLESIIDTASTETITLLLNMCQVSEPVTEQMVLQAVRNHRDGKEIINLLHTKYNTTEKITANVITNAAEFGTKEIFMCLANIAPSSAQPSLQIIEAAMNNMCDGNNILAHLLSQPNVGLLITDELLNKTARSGSYDTMALLLKAADGRISITHDMAIEAAKNRAWGNEILCLFQEKEPNIGTSLEVINAAILYGSEVTVGRLINILETTHMDLPLDTAALLAAKCEEGPESMSLLLTRFGDAVPITPEVMQAATENTAMGHVIVPLLIEASSRHISFGGQAEVPPSFPALGNGLQAHNSFGGWTPRVRREPRNPKYVAR
ncbi:hypothetical protein DTO164E3_6322 [Paecilomyces variotii]|nr:hypothetical protein DTO164E3_6322 [Paecilomyces variotii]KAJ9288869.1 hypothetical protein DTO021C3_3669 [Paecilomyces variotii]KAJ9407840.1 hypothetical protein DTO045G8_4307 [Paecilomyces variotii]